MEHCLPLSGFGVAARLKTTTFSYFSHFHQLYFFPLWRFSLIFFPCCINFSVRVFFFSYSFIMFYFEVISCLSFPHRLYIFLIHGFPLFSFLLYAFFFPSMYFSFLFFYIFFRCFSIYIFLFHGFPVFSFLLY